MNLALQSGWSALSQAIDQNPLRVVPETTVLEAIAQMNQRGSSCALVMTGSKLVGIFTERDVVKATARESRSLGEITIAELMTPQVITYEVTATCSMFSIIDLLNRHRIRHLPLVDAAQQVIGLITQRTLRQALEPTDLLRLRQVSEVMATEVVCIRSDATAMQVAQQMAERRVSCVVVVADEDDWATSPCAAAPLGIITERDIVQFRLLDLDLDRTLAAEVMSRPLFPICETATLWQAHQKMVTHRVRRVVVVDEAGKLAGIITQSRLLQSLNPLEIEASIATLREAVAEKTAELAQVNQQLMEKVADYKLAQQALQYSRRELEAALADSQQSQQSLQETNQALEQRVQERTAALEVANLVLQKQLDFTTHPAPLMDWLQRSPLAPLFQPLPLPSRLQGARFPFWVGAVITGGLATVVELCRQRGVMLPVPFMLVLLSSVLAAGIGGLRAGLASIAVWIVFLLHAASVPWGPETLTGGPIQIIMGALLMLFAVLMQGIAQDRKQQMATALKLMNQTLDQQIHQRTAALLDANRQLLQENQERQRVEAALQQSEQRFRTMFEQAAVGIAHADPASGRFLRVNQQFCDFLGYTAAELQQLRIADISLPGDVTRDRQQLSRLLANEIRVYSREKRYVRKNGELVWGSVTVSLVHDVTGKLDYILGMVEDLSSYKRTELALHESEERFRRAILNSPFPTMLHAEDGEVLQINHAWTEITGYPQAEIPTIEQWTEKAYGHRKALAKSKIDQLYQLDARVDEGEFPVTTRSGETRIWDFSSAPVGPLPDGRRLVISVAKDITEQRQLEQIKRDADAKTLLLKEINHRVKNNLQVISGLLYLQARSISHDATIRALQESRKRIEAMALIHEKLYCSDKLDSIDLKDYVSNLLENISTSYKTRQNIELKMAIDSIHLDTDAAIPCGLIINELVSNALEHAFCEGQPGKITIAAMTVIQGQRQSYELSVRDSGKGLPEAINFETQNSLGLRLVRVLAVRQLKGTVHIERTAGTLFTVRFNRRRLDA